MKHLNRAATLAHDIRQLGWKAGDAVEICRDRGLVLDVRHQSGATLSNVARSYFKIDGDDMKTINRAAPITVAGYRRPERWATFARWAIAGALLTAAAVYMVTK